VNKWSLRSVPGKGVGLVANRHLSAGELIVSVPCGMLLGMSNAVDSGMTAKKSATSPKIAVPKVFYDLLVKFADNPTFQLTVLLLFCR
jgi:hypothetical protein